MNKKINYYIIILLSFFFISTVNANQTVDYFAEVYQEKGRSSVDIGNIATLGDLYCNGTKINSDNSVLIEDHLIIKQKNQNYRIEVENDLYEGMEFNFACEYTKNIVPTDDGRFTNVNDFEDGYSLPLNICPEGYTISGEYCIKTKVAKRSDCAKATDGASIDVEYKNKTCKIKLSYSMVTGCPDGYRIYTGTNTTYKVDGKDSHCEKIVYEKKECLNESTTANSFFVKNLKYIDEKVDDGIAHKCIADRQVPKFEGHFCNSGATYNESSKKCFVKDDEKRNVMNFTIKAKASKPETTVKFDINNALREVVIVGDGSTFDLSNEYFSSSFNKLEITNDANYNKAKNNLIINENIKTGISVSYKSSGKAGTYKFDAVYKKTKDGKVKAQHVIHVIVELSNSGKIFAFGTEGCSASGTWNSISAEAARLDIGNPMLKWEKKYSTGTTDLPKCNDLDSLYFEGWYYHTGDLGSLTLNTDVCKDYVIEGTKTNNNLDVGAILKANRYRKGAFVSCYSKKKSVRIVTGANSELVDGTGWKQISSSDIVGGYYQLLTAENPVITLPNVKVTEQLQDGMQKFFTGWEKDECTIGEKMPAGRTITEDGTYMACYSSEPAITDGATLGTKKIKLEHTLHFSSRLKTTTSVKIVKGEERLDGNEYIEISPAETNYFNIYGKTVTPEGQPIKIEVKGKNNEQDITVYYLVEVFEKDNAWIGDDGSSYGTEGRPISAEDGSEYDLVGFATGATAADPQCTKYKVTVDPQTRQEKGKLIMHTGGKDLRAHRYFVKQDCGDGNVTEYNAVCLDAGREEPDGHLYYRANDPSFDDMVDLMSIAIYNQPKSTFDVNSVNDLAAATFALRLMAILAGDDLNNVGNDLDEYYRAYAGIASTIKSRIGISGKIKYSNFNTDQTRDKINGYSSNAKGFFCKKDQCSIPDNSMDIINKAYKYFKATANMTKPTNEFKPTVSTTSSNVIWTDKDNGKYTKEVYGKITGLRRDKATAVLDIQNVCEQCGEDSGVTVELLIGRDKNHLVSYYSKVEYLYATYADFNNDRNNFKFDYDKDYEKYKDQYLVDETGTLYYKYIITGNIYTISNRNLSSGGSDGTGISKKDFNAYIGLGNNDAEYKIETGKVLPSSSSNLQRLEVFAKPTKGKGATGGTLHGGAGQGSGSDASIKQKVYSKVPSKFSFDYKPGGSPKTLYLHYDSSTPSTILPVCDETIPVFNPKSSKFNSALFRAAGCCERYGDESDADTLKVFQNYCTEKCSFNSFTPICNVNNKEKKIETFQIHEGMKKDSEGNEVGQMTCVYDNASKISGGTFNYPKDEAGNPYALKLYMSNSVCNVYCKEDWDFTLPGYPNFTGHNAVIAGQYFEINKDQIKIDGRRTCVTSFIDVNAWDSKLQSLSDKMVEAFNASQAYEAGVYSPGDWKSKKEATNIDMKYTLALDKVVECKKTQKANSEKHICEVVSNNGKDCTYKYYKKHETTDYDCDSNGTYSCSSCTSTGGKCSKDTDTTYECDGDVKNGPGLTCDYTYTVDTTYLYTVIDYIKYSGVTNKTARTSGQYVETEKYKNQGCIGFSESDINETDKASYEQKALADAAKNTDSGAPGRWTSLRSQIKRLIEDMNQCQRFELVTEGKQSNRVIYHDEDITLTVQDIYTLFQPEVSYEYDDQTYMAKIGTNNKLEVEIDPKSWYQGYGFYRVDGFDANRYEGSGKTDTGDQHIGIPNNSTTAASCTRGGSGTGHTGGNKEEGGHVYHWSSEPGCSTLHPKYYEDGDYIKRYLGMKATVKKDYSWFIDNKSEFREYAKTLEEAVKNSKSNNKDPKTWSYYGTSNIDNIVFPVAKTAPRNYYKYKFIYRNIGMYNETSNTGRIMGNATKSTIANNKRICYYEVVEGICYCCGDVMKYEVVTNNIIPPLESQVKIDGKCSGTACDTMLTENMVTNYAITPITLNNIVDNLGREIGYNWRENTKFLYDGVRKEERKGADLLKYLESEGENVYSRTPEYTYVLNPADLSGIRNISAREGYQPKTETLFVIGKRYRVKPKGDSWIINDNAKDVGFVHFGSKFIRDHLVNMITPEYKDRVITLTENICEVTAKEFKNNSFNFVSKFYDTSTGKYKCRFVDYIGYIDNKDSQPFRLVFK